jgi:hypothetical protein
MVLQFATAPVDCWVLLFSFLYVEQLRERVVKVEAFVCRDINMSIVVRFIVGGVDFALIVGDSSSR